MPTQTCSRTRHIWHVSSDGDTLNTGELSHGHRCNCGRRVIARVECSEGCRHRRVLSKTDFDKLMEDK